MKVNRKIKKKIVKVEKNSHSGGLGREKSVNLHNLPSNPISLTWKSEILQSFGNLVTTFSSSNNSVDSRNEVIKCDEILKKIKMK